jgi:hypothetical protein
MQPSVQYRVRGVLTVFLLAISFLLQGNAHFPPIELPGGTPLPPETPVEIAAPESTGPSVPLPPETVLSIDDFEDGSDGWTAFRDEATSSTVTCSAEQGTGNNGSTSLRIDFSVDPGSWATCTLFFDTPQDWNAGEWLAFDIHSEKSGQPFNVIVYGGTPVSMETYIQKKVTPVAFPEGYNTFTSMWKELLRAEGEDKAGSPFEQPGQVTGLAFGFDAGPDAPYTDSVWIDNIRLEKSPTYPESPNLRSCLSSILLPLAVMGAARVFRRK